MGVSVVHSAKTLTGVGLTLSAADSDRTGLEMELRGQPGCLATIVFHGGFPSLSQGLVLTLGEKLVWPGLYASEYGAGDYLFIDHIRISLESRGVDPAGPLPVLHLTETTQVP